MSDVTMGDIIIPKSWGLVPLGEVPKVVEGDEPNEARVRFSDSHWLSAYSAEEAREISQRILDDLYRFQAIRRWFETREERAREKVLHEFNADTEGNLLPLNTLVDSLVDEIHRLRQKVTP